MVFAAFWSENGYRLCPFNFGLGSGIVIEETKGVNERIIVRGIQFQMSKKLKQKYANSKRI